MFSYGGAGPQDKWAPFLKKQDLKSLHMSNNSLKNVTLQLDGMNKLQVILLFQFFFPILFTFFSLFYFIFIYFYFFIFIYFFISVPFFFFFFFKGLWRQLQWTVAPAPITQVLIESDGAGLSLKWARGCAQWAGQVYSPQEDAPVQKPPHVAPKHLCRHEGPGHPWRQLQFDQSPSFVSVYAQIAHCAGCGEQSLDRDSGRNWKSEIIEEG